jgi:hypothetical protein
MIVPCGLPKNEMQGLDRECYQSESYWAERKGNDTTLSTIRGSVRYHINASW